MVQSLPYCLWLCSAFGEHTRIKNGSRDLSAFNLSCLTAAEWRIIMKEYKVEGHVSSFLPEDKEWKLVWNDEFDGDRLDTSKWYYRLHMAGKRHETYIEDGISFDGNSNIVFHLIEKDGQYYSSTIQTGENRTDKPNDE